MRFLITISFLLLTFLGFAQQKLRETEVDSLTFFHYNNKNWEILLSVSKNAIEQDIDFYYLRLRSGIAANQLKDYVTGQKHFQKAFDFFPSDTLVRWYLFYTAIENNDLFTANLIYKKYNTFQTLIKPYRLGISSINSEYGMQQSNVDQNITDKKIINSSSDKNSYKEVDKLNSISYLSVSANVTVRPNIFLTLAYANVILNKTQSVFYNSIINENSHNVIQNEFHLGTNILLPKYFSITGAIHYFNYRTSLLTAKYESAKANYSLSRETYTGESPIGWLSISKLICNRLLVEPHFTHATFGTLNTSQFGISALYYPLNNKKLFFSIIGASSNDQNNSRMITSAKIGIQIHKKIWLQAYSTFGNLTNYVEAGGLIVYNIADKITSRTGGNLNISLGKHLGIEIRYDFIQREGYFYETILNQESKSTSYNYQNQSLIGGIKWKF